MDKLDQKKIEEIKQQLDCPKEFCCIDGCEKICKARDFGLNEFVECLEENSHKCEFALSFGYGKFCKCKLRVYLAKRLQE